MRQRDNVENHAYRLKKMITELKQLKIFAIVILLFNLYTLIRYLYINWAKLGEFIFFMKPLPKNYEMMHLLLSVLVLSSFHYVSIFSQSKG